MFGSFWGAGASYIHTCCCGGLGNCIGRSWGWGPCACCHGGRGRHRCWYQGGAVRGMLSRELGEAGGEGHVHDTASHFLLFIFSFMAAVMWACCLASFYLRNFLFLMPFLSVVMVSIIFIWSTDVSPPPYLVGLRPWQSL